MNIDQRNHLLLQTVAIDRNFNRVSHQKTHQDTMRLINRLAMELYETQKELKELKDKFDKN